MLFALTLGIRINRTTFEWLLVLLRGKFGSALRSRLGAALGVRLTVNTPMIFGLSRWLRICI